MQLTQKQIARRYIDTIANAKLFNFLENEIIYIEESNLFYISKTSTDTESLPDIIVCNDGKRLFKIANVPNGSNILDPRGSMFLENNSTITVISTINQWVKIAGTTVSSNNIDFSMTANNQLTYTGISQYLARIKVTLSAEKQGGGGGGNTAGRNFQFSIFINGVKLQNVTTQENLTGTFESITILASEIVNNGDFIEIYVRNIENRDDVLVTDLHFLI